MPAVKFDNDDTQMQMHIMPVMAYLMTNSTLFSVNLSDSEVQFSRGKYDSKTQSFSCFNLVQADSERTPEPEVIEFMCCLFADVWVHFVYSVCIDTVNEWGGVFNDCHLRKRYQLLAKVIVPHLSLFCPVISATSLYRRIAR